MKCVKLIIIFLVFFASHVTCNKNDIQVQDKNDTAETPTWRILSGAWRIDENIISTVSTINENKDFILVNNITSTDSRWESLHLEFMLEDNMTNISAGLALNTKSKDNFGFLRIRKSDNQTFLQAGVWEYGSFRTILNTPLEENLSYGEWYYLKIIPTKERDILPPWTIILGEKSEEREERVIFERAIHNQRPLFGRGAAGLYADQSNVTFKNFEVKKASEFDHADSIRVAPLFKNGMVLQRRTTFPVWGKGLPGKTVKITIFDEEFSSVVDESGDWKINLHPLEAAESTEMVISSNNDTIQLQDIAIGEVWLASGQSNMEMQVWQSDVNTIAEKIKTDENLRFFIQPKWPSEIPLFDNGGNWQKAVPENIEKWSAVAYSFALQIREKLDIPVGIIFSAWGGTTAECWLPRDMLKNDPYTKPILDQYEYAKNALEKGENIVGVHPYNVPGQHKSPGALFNGMINPLVPFPVKGVIWYQGESNTERAKQYEALFALLINSWRGLWNNPELYFAYVQLAGYDGGESGANIDSAWPQLRDAQRSVMDKLNHVGMAVAIDLGHPTNIHPRQKIEVGDRLARWVLHDMYGFNEVVRSGPLYSSVSFTGNRGSIYFSEVANGLEINNGKDLQGFTIAGEDQVFVTAKAEINSDKRSITVWSDNVNKPVAVRYAWSNNPTEANLTNSENLPASPFRTDTWPLPTDNNR